MCVILLGSQGEYWLVLDSELVSSLEGIISLVMDTIHRDSDLGNILEGKRHLTWNFLWFASRSISELAETHFKTSLRSVRNPWKNFHKPSQPGIWSFDHPFARPVREPLVQLQIGDSTWDFDAFNAMRSVITSEKSYQKSCLWTVDWRIMGISIVSPIDLKVTIVNLI